MAKRMSPWLAVLWTELALFALAVVGGMSIASHDDSFRHDPHAAGVRVGRMIAPIMILAGFIVYFVQKRRVASDASGTSDA